MNDQSISSSLLAQTRQAREAALCLGNLPTERKNRVLQASAIALRDRSREILEANALDLEEAEKMRHKGTLTESAYRRVALSQGKIEQMALNCESVARLDDPVGRIQQATRLDDGLDLYRVSCPIGVILVIFESRPDAVVQISTLAIKSGNAVILKGGREAQHSNRKLVELLRETASQVDGMPIEAISLIETREDVAMLVRMSDELDMIIPRGSNELVRSIQSQAQVPVLGHADGICHVYLDAEADLEKAREIVIDSKTEYPAVCNAMETLLVDSRFDDRSLTEILLQLQQAGVELRVCTATRARLQDRSGLELRDADEADWMTEYTDLILSVKTVNSPEDAIVHINHYGSRHTDCIVTENRKRGEWFMNKVDAAGVFWNASTRFADGFRYGLGAEVGVSTSKTHARGPVGLEGLVIYKYKLYGSGQGVGRYGQEERKFLHESLKI